MHPDESPHDARTTGTGSGAITLLLSMGDEFAGKDPERAIACYREARELAQRAGDLPNEARALQGLGSVHANRGDTDAARETLEAALRLARETDDDAAIAHGLNELGLWCMRQGMTDDALAYLRESMGRTPEAAHDRRVARIRARTLENLGAVYRETAEPSQAQLYYEEALEIHRAAGDASGIASCHNHLGSLFHRMGRFKDAATRYELALESRRDLGDRHGTASSANNLAGSLLMLGRLKEASELFDEARQLAEELNEPARLASILSNTGLLRSYEGRIDEAETLHRQSLEIHRKRGDSAGQAHALNNLSSLAVDRGRLDDAIGYADECIRLWEVAGRRGNVAKPWANRGRALLELGRVSEARDAAERALDAAKHAQSAEYRAEALALGAEVACVAGDLDGAIRLATEAADSAERAESPPLRASCATILGRLHLEAGRLEEAKRHLETATRHARGMPGPYERACILAEQGKLLARAGSEEAGAERLRKALGEFERLGNHRWQVRVLADLSHVRASDPDESARLRAQAKRLAERHSLEDLVAEPTWTVREPRGDVVDASEWESILNLWLHAARRSSEDPAEFLDPWFAFLRRRYRVTRVELALSAAFGTFASSPADSGDAGGGAPPERVEWAWESAVTAGTLTIARDTAFEASERAALRAFARVAALALDGCLDRIGKRGVASAETVERFEGLIGTSPAMREVYRLIEQVAPSDSSVLLLGESGTGKELAARAIHARSSRHGRPFVTINCPSIPRELIESELFGHEKGSFTGADARRPGKVELADGGTLFLDEVGDMAIATQVRLLRFLEEREFQRVGGRETLHVDVRILAATSRDLADDVERKDFRRDLYYRLNVVPIRMPGLRERREDLPTLCDHFLASFAQRGRSRHRLSERALQILVAHDWPGNVRELRNTLEYMATVAGEEILDEPHLPAAFRARASSAGARLGESAESFTLNPGESLASRLRELEAVLIRRALEDADWNQSEAARRLGITETKVRNRRRQYGIRRPDGKGDAE